VRCDVLLLMQRCGFQRRSSTPLPSQCRLKSETVPKVTTATTAATTHQTHHSPPPPTTTTTTAAATTTIVAMHHITCCHHSHHCPPHSRSLALPLTLPRSSRMYVEFSDVDSAALAALENDAASMLQDVGRAPTASDTIYLDCAHGDDRADGTEGKPLKTVLAAQNASRASGAGSTVFVAS
jgi:hypothetical protein